MKNIYFFLNTDTLDLPSIHFPVANECLEGPTVDPIDIQLLTFLRRFLIFMQLVILIHIVLLTPFPHLHVSMVCYLPQTDIVPPFKKGKIIFQLLLFRVHVSFRGGI